MKQQLHTLIQSFHGSYEPLLFNELFAACCAWVKLERNGEIDGQNQTLEEVFRNPSFSSFYQKSLTDEKLASTVERLTSSMQELVGAGVVTYQDLSETITHLCQSAGRQVGALSHPQELLDLGVQLLEGQVTSVYCPFNAGYQFGQNVQSGGEIVCETMNMTDAFLGQVHNLLLDKSVDIIATDPIKTPKLIGEGGLKQFSSAVAMPPFGVKYGKDEVHDIWGRFPEKSLMGDVYHLRHMLAHADLVVCYVTNGFLFRTAAGEKHFKQDIVEKNWLKAVISLPGNLLTDTSIPVSVVVIDKNKTDDQITFIDASSDHFIEKLGRVKNKLSDVEQVLKLVNSEETTVFSKRCSVRDVEEMDFNWSPNRYVQSEEEAELSSFLSQFKTAKLSDVADIVRLQAIKHDENGTETFIEHNLTSLNAIGQLAGEGKKLQVSSKDINKAKKQQVKPHDVLVSCRGAVGRIALIDENVPTNTLASQAFAIVRIKPHVEGITSLSLYQYLVSYYGQLQFSGLVTGTTAQMLNAKDLGDMPIPLFEHEKLEVFDSIRAKTLDYQQQLNKIESAMKQLSSSWIDQVQ